MQKRDLTKQKICEKAVRLIEEEGLEGLSMRKLAAELNVEAASLYNHITGKGELFDLVQEHLYQQLSVNVSEGNWKSHLYDLAVATRLSLLRVPKIVLLFATRPTITTSSLKQAERTLTILIEAGFKPSQVLLIYRNLHAFVLGHVLAEVGQVPGEKDDHNEPSLHQINLDYYPMLRKTSTYKSGVDFEKGFILGLHCMLNGLETLLRG